MTWKDGTTAMDGTPIYVIYNKVAVNRDFLNHIVRKSLYKVWTNYRWLLEPKIKKACWVPPLEVVAVRRTNMGKGWPTYQQLLIKEHSNVKLKPYVEIKNYCNSWLQYHQVVYLFNQDKKNRIWTENIKISKWTFASKQENYIENVQLTLRMGAERWANKRNND